VIDEDSEGYKKKDGVRKGYYVFHPIRNNYQGYNTNFILS
jgi:hypothetical protein